MNKYFFIIVMLLSALGGCREEVNEVFMPYDEVSATEYFRQHPEYSGWYALLERAGMVETYNFSTTPMTCFIVQNDSLLAYIHRRGYEKVEDMPVEVARNLLQYHTIPNYAREFSSFRDGKLVDSTSSGDYLACQFLTDEGIIKMNREAEILVWDIEVVNGLMHRLDRVMDPITTTLYDYLQNPRFSIMAELSRVTATDTLLRTLNRTDIPIKCQRTLFAVSDSIFALPPYNIHSFADLVAKISPAGNDYADPANALNIFMRYHILDDNYTTEALGQQLSYTAIKGREIIDKDKGIVLESLAENKLVQVDYKGNEYLINGTWKFVGDNFNIQAKNGCVHEINGIMPVYEPQNVRVYAEATAAMQFQQLTEYRDKDIQKTIVNLTKEMFLPVVKWQSSPSNKIDAVGYLVFTRGDASPDKQHGILHGDYLYLSLGAVGYVEVTTAPIPKGKYKIWILHKKSKDLGGNFNAFLDGEWLPGLIRAYTTGDDEYLWSEYGQREYVFYETEPHTLKLSVAKQGELYWDMVLFEPIN